MSLHDEFPVYQGAENRSFGILGCGKWPFSVYQGAVKFVPSGYTDLQDPDAWYTRVWQSAVFGIPACGKSPFSVYRGAAFSARTDEIDFYLDSGMPGEESLRRLIVTRPRLPRSDAPNCSSWCAETVDSGGEVADQVVDLVSAYFEISGSGHGRAVGKRPHTF